MKLRNFLYLNTKVVEDYVATIEGYTYDNEIQTVSSGNKNTIEGKAGIPLVSGGGSHVGQHDEEIKRVVTVSDAAKFEKVYNYLQSDEEDGLKYYELFSEDTFNGIARDEFIEVLVTARFSKMKVLSDSVEKLTALVDIVQPFSEQKILNNETSEALKGFSLLKQIKNEKGIACVFEFSDGKYPLVAYLDESYFRCSQDNFVGESYVLCKAIRKIPKGENIKLDELFDDIKKMPLNREQRRSIGKDLDNPDEIKDVIKGPAIIILPIAVYQ